RFRNGASQSKQNALGGHLEDVQTRAAGSQFQIATHVPTGMKDFEVVIDEGGCGSKLGQQTAIEFLLGFQIVPIGIRLADRQAKRIGIITIGLAIERESNDLTGSGGLFGKNLECSIFHREKIGHEPGALRSPQQKKSLGPSSVVEQRNHFVLQNRFEIDEEIAAGN